MTLLIPSIDEIKLLGEWRKKVLSGEISDDTEPPVKIGPVPRVRRIIKSTNTLGVDLSEFLVEVPIIKADEEKQTAFGWASIAKRSDGTDPYDTDGDVIDDLDDFEAAAYNFVVESRVGGENHIRKGVAELIESVVFTPKKIEAMGLPPGSLPTAWWVGFKVNDDDVWEGVKKGRYKMFSVHGRGVRKEIE